MTIMVRPEWPKVTCPAAEHGIHSMRFDLGTWLCRFCEAEISNDDLDAVMRLWQWVHATVGQRLN